MLAELWLGTGTGWHATSPWSMPQALGGLGWKDLWLVTRRTLGARCLSQEEEDKSSLVWPKHSGGDGGKLLGKGFALRERELCLWSIIFLH